MNRGTLPEQLVGFDAREAWIGYAEAWPESRRERYLLRTDVEKPLSVDRLVWPSLLERNLGARASASNPLGLRNAIDDVQRVLAESTQRLAGPYMPVAATLAAIQLAPDEEQQWAPIFAVLPGGGPSRDWPLLGYDVADLGLTSGLMNSGYSSDDRAALHARWAPLLNQFHLLTDREQATEFKTISDRRVPEHAPFFVYGLYRIEQVT